MKTSIVRTSGMLAAGLLLAATTASAGPQEPEIIAKVPFDFLVGTTKMPAGTYIVKSAFEDPTVVLVESTDGRHAAFAMTIPESEAAPNESTLVFERRENQYVLFKLMPSDGIGRELILTHARAAHEAPVPTAEP